MQQTNSYDERIIKINTFRQGNEIPITCFFFLKKSLISQSSHNPANVCKQISSYFISMNLNLIVKGLTYISSLLVVKYQGIPGNTDLRFHEIGQRNAARTAN